MGGVVKGVTSLFKGILGGSTTSSTSKTTSSTSKTTPVTSEDTGREIAAATTDTVDTATDSTDSTDTTTTSYTTPISRRKRSYTVSGTLGL